MQKKNILWLREDFRLEDNPALYEISKKSEKFTIFYFIIIKNLKIDLHKDGGCTSRLIIIKKN